MRQLVSLATKVLVMAICIWPCVGVGTEEGGMQKENLNLRLCDALEAVGYGDRIRVVVSGVYQVSAEMSMLYDPGQQFCEFDVQPSTWIEFAPDVLAQSPDLYQDLRRLTEAPKAVLVTFEGELWGPKAVGEDDPTAPVMIAYANRVAYQRYGHSNAFRTKLVVRSIHAVRAVPTSEVQPGERHRPNDEGTIPVIKDAKIPRYPPRAQLAGIEGKVIVKVRVENGAVVEATALSGDRLLMPDTLSNIESWQFESDVSTSFISTFLYRLELRRTNQPRYPKILLELPEKVTIIGASNGW